MAITTWQTATTSHPGVSLHRNGDLTLGGKRHNAPDEIRSVRLGIWTFNKLPGAGSEVSGVSDHGQACGFRFNAALGWERQFFWKTLIPGFVTKVFQLQATGEIRFSDGTIVRSTSAFTKRLIHGGISFDLHRPAGSAVFSETSPTSQRLFGFDAGTWHELLDVFALNPAPAIRPMAGKVRPPTMVAATLADPPDARWRRIPIDVNLHNIQFVGRLGLLDSGDVTLGSRTVPPGHEILNHRIDGHIANRRAGANELLVIDLPTGETLYFGRHHESWYRFAPLPGEWPIIAYVLLDDWHQWGVIAPLKWLIQFIGAALVFVLVTALCAGFLFLLFVGLHF